MFLTNDENQVIVKSIVATLEHRDIFMVITNQTAETTILPPYLRNHIGSVNYDSFLIAFAPVFTPSKHKIMTR